MERNPRQFEFPYASPDKAPGKGSVNGTAALGHLTMGIHYSRLLITMIGIGAEQGMWEKKKRARSNALALAYVQRLQAIDALSSAHDELGPSEWNMGLGQSEFLGRTKSGDFPNRYIVVEVEDLPTFGQLREKSDDWIHLSREQMLQQITGFWTVVLRTSDQQPFQPTSEVEYRFDSFLALQKFLAPLAISWHGASATERQLNQSGWSPDWLS